MSAMSRVPKPSDHLQRDGERRHRDRSSRSIRSCTRQPIDPAQVFAQARQSTVAKTREIIDLRAEVCTRDSGLLALVRRRHRRQVRGRRAPADVRQRRQRHRRAGARVAVLVSPRRRGRRCRRIGLSTDVSVLTSLANDIGVEVVFSRQIAAFGQARRHRARAVDERQLREPAAGVRRGQAAWPADGRDLRLRRRQDGRAGQPGLPLRRAVVVDPPDPGSADDDLPHLVGAGHGRGPQQPVIDHGHGASSSRESATSSSATTASAWRSRAGWPSCELPEWVTVGRLRHQRHASGL